MANIKKTKKKHLFVIVVSVCVALVVLIGYQVVTGIQAETRRSAFMELIDRHPYVVDYMFEMNNEHEIEQFLLDFTISNLDFRINSLSVNFRNMELPPYYDNSSFAFRNVYINGSRVGVFAQDFDITR